MVFDPPRSCIRCSHAVAPRLRHSPRARCIAGAAIVATCCSYVANSPFSPRRCRCNACQNATWPLATDFYFTWACSRQSFVLMQNCAQTCQERAPGPRTSRHKWLDCCERSSICSSGCLQGSCHTVGCQGTLYLRHISTLHLYTHSCSVATLFAHAFQPFAGPSVYRDSDDFALLAVCSCHCSRTMVEANFMQLSPLHLVASWHEHAGSVQPRSCL